MDQRVEKWTLQKGCCINPSQALTGETGFSSCFSDCPQVSPGETRKMILGRLILYCVYWSFKAFRNTVQKQNVDLLRLLMRGKGRKAVEGTRKLLSLGSREEDKEG